MDFEAGKKELINAAEQCHWNGSDPEWPSICFSVLPIAHRTIIFRLPLSSPNWILRKYTAGHNSTDKLFPLKPLCLKTTLPLMSVIVMEAAFTI